MLPRIFIGGTGRSGTTILYRALGCHKDIYALPKEMRFIIEADGLMDLVDALTTRYSVNQAREALYKFERLMRVYMAKPDGPHYPAYDLPSWLGGDYYYKCLDQFCSELVELEFKGISIPLRSPELEGSDRWKQQFRQLMRRHRSQPIRPYMFPQSSIRVVKYFSNRQEMLDRAAAFIDDLFLHVAREEDKQTWCEKTPTNIQHLDFLWELFPQSVFIHMKRDPRGVVQSMKKVRWAPNDTRGTCLFLRKIYDRWFDIQANIGPDKKYIEVQLEQLAECPKAILAQIASVCGLPNQFENLPEIMPEKINNWREKMSREDIELVNEMLGPYIERMGYEI